MYESGFYMVFLEGGSTPTVKHPTFESAAKEAERLTLQNGLKSYILGTIRSIEVPPKTIMKDCDVNNNPF